ncbi:MAG: hypothetical protein ACOVQT_14485 [Rubrivivax sp.]|jgi:hypothetical protein
MIKHLSPACALVWLALAAPAGAWTNTEFLYTPQTPDLTRVIVNNPGRLSAAPVAGLNLLANNFLDVNAGATFAAMSPNYWSGVTWTGLDPADRSPASQRAAKAATDSAPGFGATVFQRSGTAVGMHLNTFGPAGFPGGAQHQSLQYRVDLNRVVWNKPDLLCVSGTMNLASSYTVGAVNQAMITLYFDNAANTAQGFHVNVMMFDSRANYPAGDNLLVDTDINSAKKPIVVTHLQTQNQNQSAYSSPVPGYGNLLEPFRQGNVAPGSRDRGFCISPTQFNRMVADINGRYGLNYATNASAYVLRYVLVGPEIYTGSGRGHIGMSVNSFWVYRRR